MIEITIKADDHKSLHDALDVLCEEQHHDEWEGNNKYHANGTPYDQEESTWWVWFERTS